jgi:hypothetical protein
MRAVALERPPVAASQPVRAARAQGNRLTALPASVGRLGALVELFITDNALEELPAELGGCAALVKVQASFNRLRALPSALARLPRLEMLRAAVCDIAEAGPAASNRLACSGPAEILRYSFELG